MSSHERAHSGPGRPSGNSSSDDYVDAAIKNAENLHFDYQGMSDKEAGEFVSRNLSGAPTTNNSSAFTQQVSTSGGTVTIEEAAYEQQVLDDLSGVTTLPPLVITGPRGAHDYSWINELPPSEIWLNGPQTYGCPFRKPLVTP